MAGIGGLLGGVRAGGDAGAAVRSSWHRAVRPTSVKLRRSGEAAALPAWRSITEPRGRMLGHGDKNVTGPDGPIAQVCVSM